MRGLARATSRACVSTLPACRTIPILLQRVVRDLADVLERQEAELAASQAALAETRATLAERNAEVEKLQLFLSALKRRIRPLVGEVPSRSAGAEPRGDRGSRSPHCRRRRPPTLGGVDRYRRSRAAGGARPSAAGGGAAQARRLRLSRLRRQAARDRRGRQRGSRLRAGAVQGNPASVPASPVGRAKASRNCRCRRCRLSAAGPPVGPRAGRQICRPYSALSAISDRRSRGRRTRHRSMLADWVGRASWLVQPLGERLAAHVFAGVKDHADDTPVPVLDPGRGRTKKGRLWVYVRDDRPCGDRARRRQCSSIRPTARVNGRPITWRTSPAAAGRRLSRLPDALRADHRDPRAGRTPGARSSTHESTKSPIAADALQKISELYKIEKALRGRPPDRRRDVRQGRPNPAHPR